MDKTAIQNRIEKLKTVINYHRYLYHVLDKQEISDSVLDSLKHQLYKMEQQYPEFITPDSPTQRVAGIPLKKFKKIKHKTLMVSIEDIFNEQELIDWENYLKQIDPSVEFNYFCERKIDGFAVSLIYKNGIFAYGATRGDGKIGEDVTQNLKTIESIPLRLKSQKDFDTKQEIEIRGEVYMGKKDFEKFNEKRKQMKEKLYSNPRNLAAGSIRQLDPKLAGSRALKFLAYDIITDLGQKKHSQEHKMLANLGFKTDLGRKCENLNEILDYWKEIEKKRNEFAFQIDGIVIQINDNRVFQKFGIVGKSFRANRALKFSPKQSITILKDIKLQIGRTGVLTPVAILEPVEIGGTVITRATLHNQDEMKKMGVKIGDTIIVERAGDVIPAVVKTLKELRTGKEKLFHFPKKCPVCHSILVREKGEKAIRCLNKNCSAIIKKSLTHFVSKKAFNIDGMGPKIIDHLIKENLIFSAYDIFALKQGDLIPLERFAEKSAKNLFLSIQQSKQISLSRFIFALGIRHIGEETAIDLARYFGSLDKIKSADIQELEKIPGMGDNASQSVYDWFRQKENQKLIANLIKAKVVVVNDLRFAPNKKLENKVFVLTGALENMTRDKAKEKIRFLGGIISESVSKKVDFVVAGENSGARKYNKARELGIKIINEKQFLEIIK
ncbi:MAG: NAD-dependent DNA ligase LigA [Patescibacteria group bacterium]|nr:NAD-dependent DNA ligase LigA [Patescibacteria group bacterium]